MITYHYNQYDLVIADLKAQRDRINSAIDQIEKLKAIMANDAFWHPSLHRYGTPVVGDSVCHVSAQAT